MASKIVELQRNYRRLAAQLSDLGYITQGSVFERKKGPGSRYQWTWKNKNQKTASLTLTAEQYGWLKEASDNQRRLNKTLSQMRRLSKQIFTRSFPKPRSRK
jgi:hypothetical protein